MTKANRRFRTLILTPADEDLVQSRLKETGMDFQDFIRAILREQTIYYSPMVTKQLLGARLLTFEATVKLLENENRELGQRLRDLQEAYKSLEIKYNALKDIKKLKEEMSETPQTSGQLKEGSEKIKEGGE